MRTYETLIVYSPDLDEGKVKAEVNLVKTLVENNKGSVTKVDMWGKCEIAYRVMKQKYGHFVLLDISTENTDLVAELERVLRLSDNVLKYKTHLTNLRRRKVKAPRIFKGLDVEFLPMT